MQSCIEAAERQIVLGKLAQGRGGTRLTTADPSELTIGECYVLWSIGWTDSLTGLRSHVPPAFGSQPTVTARV